ncbi:MAG TPA: PAS domain S-box protein [Gemmataceae bacterium]|nr:PAS domain S-box protein [Gemmataceae bacterium]
MSNEKLPEGPGMSGKLFEATDRAILEALPNLLFVVDADGKFLDYHAPSDASLYVPPSAFLGRTIREVLPEPVATLIAEKVAQALRTETPQTLEYSLPMPGGTRHYRARFARWSRSVLVSAEEITLQKEAESTLRRNEQRFRALLENAFDGVSCYDAHGNETYISPRNTRYDGWSLDELRDKGPFDVVYPDDRDRVRSIFAELAATPGKKMKTTFRTVRKDGSVRWVEGHGHNLLHDPAVGAVVVNWQDVTERMAAEDKLREAEARLRLALDAAHMLVWDWDIEANEIAFSEDYGKFFGLPPTGKTVKNDDSILEPVFPDDRGPLVDAFQRSLDTGQDFQLQFRGKSRDGATAWYLARGRMQKAVDGASRMIGVTLDITLQKKAEDTLLRSNEELERLVQARTRELLQSEDKYRTLVTEMNDGLYIADTQGSVTFANPALARILGFEHPDHVVGKKFFDFIAPAMVEEIARYFSQAVESGRTREATTAEIIRRDGTNAAVDVRSSALVEDGKVAGLKGVIRDITDRKRAERALRESEERFSKAFRDNQVAMGIRRLSDDRVIETNASFDRLLRRSREQIIGQKIGDLGLYLNPEQRAHVLEAADRRQSIQSIEIEFNNGAGATTYVLMAVDYITLGGEVCALASFIDITDRKQVEEQLRQKEYLLSQSQRIAQIGSWSDDLVAQRVTFTDEAYRLYGVSPDTFVPSAEAVVSLVHADDRDALQKQIGSVIAGKNAGPLEFRVPQTDGSIRILRGQGEMTRDDAGRPVRLIGTIQDITESRLAEETLRKRILELTALNRVGVICSEVSSEDEILRRATLVIAETLCSNTCGFLLLDATRGTLIPHRSAVIANSNFDMSPIPIDKGLVGLAARTGKPRCVGDVSHESEYLAADPSTRSELCVPIKINSRVIGVFNAESEALNTFSAADEQLVTTIVDIVGNTLERLRAEKELRESQQRLSGLVESAMDAIVCLDEEQRVILFNPAAEKLFGVPALKMVGMPLDRLLPDASRAAHADAIEEFGKTGKTNRKMGEFGTVTGVRPDGSVFPIEASISHIDADGKKIYTAILRDVTDRLRAQEILRQSLKDKDALLKEVHHRVKNNLQIINSLLNLQAATIKDPTILALFADSQNRVRSMALVHETLYRSDCLGAVNLAEYLGGISDQLFRAYNTDPVRIKMTVDIAEADIDLERAIPCGLIVNELVSNALKHAFPNGRTGNIRIAFARVSDKDYALTVADNGVGLPAGSESLPTTLGLQLVPDLTKQLGGLLACKSGGGTTFRITFPIKARK